MAALRKSLTKPFWEGPDTDQTVCGLVVSAPTACPEVEQVPLKGAVAVGAAPVGVVVSVPVSPPVEPTQMP